MKALVDSSGKVMVGSDGKVATDDCPGTCCTTTATGACCHNDGTCEILSAADCEATEDGNYIGDNTVCDPNPCLGACCVDEDCSVLSEDDCDTAGGTYHGDGTVCDPNPCLCFCSISTLGILSGTVGQYTGCVDPGEDAVDLSVSATTNLQTNCSNITLNDTNDAVGQIIYSCQCPGDDIHDQYFRIRALANTSTGELQVSAIISGPFNPDFQTYDPPHFACGSVLSVSESIAHVTYGSCAEFIGTHVFSVDSAFLPGLHYDVTVTIDGDPSFDGTWQSRDAAFRCSTICCESTPDLDITNCFDSVFIEMTLNFDAFGSPEDCIPNSGTVTTSQAFTRVPKGIGFPTYPLFNIITSEDPCGWGIVAPDGGSFFSVFVADANDDACDTPGTATFGANVNLASNFMIAEFNALFDCGGGACLFDPVIPVDLGEFDFDSCTHGTHTFTGSDGNANWSYTVSVAVTLS